MRYSLSVKVCKVCAGETSLTEHTGLEKYKLFKALNILPEVLSEGQYLYRSPRQVLNSIGGPGV